MRISETPFLRAFGEAKMVSRTNPDSEAYRDHGYNKCKIDWFNN